jgi:hypothetical protein
VANTIDVIDAGNNVVNVATIDALIASLAGGFPVTIIGGSNSGNNNNVVVVGGVINVGNPVSVSGGTVNVGNQPTSIAVTGGLINIGNPAAIGGIVNVGNQVTVGGVVNVGNQVTVAGTVSVNPATISGGVVNVGNPITTVNIGNSITVGGGTVNVGNPTTVKSIKTVSGSLTANAAALIAAVTSKRLKITSYSLITAGTNQNLLTFKTSSGTEVWRVILQAGSNSSLFGANMTTPAPSFLFGTVAGEALSLTVSAGDTVHYAISYFDDDAS